MREILSPFDQVKKELLQHFEIRINRHGSSFYTCKKFTAEIENAYALLGHSKTEALMAHRFDILVTKIKHMRSAKPILTPNFARLQNV